MGDKKTQPERAEHPGDLDNAEEKTTDKKKTAQDDDMCVGGLCFPLRPPSSTQADKKEGT